MLGTVVNLEALVKVAFHLEGKPDVEIEFVIDTGFAGALTLPPSMIQSLGLDYVQDMVATLANDSDTKVDIYAANISWLGRELRATVLEMGKRPLLGTALLEGYELCARFEENGTVTISQS